MSDQKTTTETANDTTRTPIVRLTNTLDAFAAREDWNARRAILAIIDNMPTFTPRASGVPLNEAGKPEPIVTPAEWTHSPTRPEIHAGKAVADALCTFSERHALTLKTEWDRIADYASARASDARVRLADARKQGRANGTAKKAVFAKLDAAKTAQRASKAVANLAGVDFASLMAADPALATKILAAAQAAAVAGDVDSGAVILRPADNSTDSQEG